MLDADAKRQEERVKLFATALSNLGVATIVAGFISPIFGGRFNIGGAVGALVLGMALHFVAQALLHYVVDTPRPLASIKAAEPETEP